jgi:hypothetical protein
MRLAPSPNAAVNVAIGKGFTKFIDLSKDVLWKDLPSLLGDHDPRSTRISPSLLIFYTSPLLPFSLLPVLESSLELP